MTLSKTQTLYEQDFALWVEETAQKLRNREFTQIDLENLIEEVESLGISQRKSVNSFLIRLLEHLLKRCYVNLPDCYRGWEIEIRNFRRELNKELKYSPSLERFILEIFAESYQDALTAMKEDYPNCPFPEECPFPNDIDRLLAQKFWEN